MIKENIFKDIGKINADVSLLEKFRTLTLDHYGIYFQDSKIDVLKMKLEKLANIHQIDLDNLYNLLLQKDPTAVDIFLKEITVGHTFFFRENQHFNVLANEIFRKRMNDVSIWSAASSTGEEPYSIAIELLEKGIIDFKILTSDINKKALHKIHQGIYSFRGFQDMDPEITRKYFKKLGINQYKIRPDLREKLIIKQINLHEDIQLQEQVDFIFCRNVMIYFDEEGRKKVIQMLVKNLKKMDFFL